MNPQHIYGATNSLQRPPNWNPEIDGECDELAIIVQPGLPGQAPRLHSAWLPTPEELQLLNEGHAVQLTVLGGVHPPVMLQVTEHRYGNTKNVFARIAELLNPYLDTGDSRSAPDWAVAVALAIHQAQPAEDPAQVPLLEDPLPLPEEGVSNGAGEEP